MSTTSMCVAFPLRVAIVGNQVTIVALEARGCSLHEISRASQQHKQFGVYFDGVARVLRHDPRRLWRVLSHFVVFYVWVGHDPESCVF